MVTITREAKPATPAKTYEIPNDLWDLAMQGWVNPEDVDLAAAETGVAQWFLHSKSPALEGKTPIEVLQEPNGAEKVRYVLGAIVYGTYI